MRIGSLFSGYGGLDMAAQAIFGGELAWWSDIEPASVRVMSAHHPGVPNLGDITKVDWSQVAPVDILTGGYPCQPFSHAGLRKGKHDERHLWPYVRDAIRVLRPRITVLENVAGHLTLGLEDVLTDLTHLGLSARWGVVRASDAGAPHQRARIFIVTYPDSSGFEGHKRSACCTSAQQHGHVEPCTCTPTPNANCDGHGQPLHSRGMGSVEGKAEASTSQRQRTRRESDAGVDWGKYEPAIRRWESLTRPAPAPTIPGTNNRPRLNPVFVEWMMGLPEGHVTGHSLSNAQQLKMLGNGVVPQQAELALQLLTHGRNNDRA